MAVELEEKQYELDERIVFGLDCPVFVTEDGFGIGDPAVTTQDIRLPARDGERMGKDYVGGVTYALKMSTSAETEAGGWEAVSRLADVWNDPAIRGESGRVVPLRWRIAKKERVVYGRPRRFTPAPNNLSLYGRIDVIADFRAVHDCFFDAQQQSVDVPVQQPLTPGAGVVVPLIVPFTSDAGASERESTLHVGGARPTPAIVDFHGPLAAGATVRVAGFTVQLPDAVPLRDTVTVDARPWIAAATNSSGGGVKLSPRITRISRMMLPPGQHEVILTAADPTGQGHVTVRWHDAYSTPR